MNGNLATKDEAFNGVRKLDEKASLSQREQQLISMAGQGMTDTAIANGLGISEATVNTYWGRIRVKIGPHNRTELVAIALREEYESRLAEMRLEAPEGPDYSIILKAAPDAIVIFTQAGIVQDANLAAGEMFGYEVSELIGLHMMALIPPRFRAEHPDHVAGYMSNPERRTMGGHMAVVGLTKDGEEFQMAAALSTVEWNGQHIAICSIRHVSG